jgi:4-amino-4-deoxy-L-arabinose transferase-like glycosyltransferase
MVRSRDSEYGAYRGRLTHERDITNTFEEIIVMIIVMVFAAAIRLWKLGAWSFWADEVFTVQDAQRLPNVFTANPVIYMIVRFFIDTLGISEWSARLGPCIIGILSVPLIYWPAKKIINAKTGMIACVFLVIHPWHIFWSQNVRAYSLAFFLTSLSACLFYLALERDRVGLMFLALLLTILSIFSYLQAVLLLPALVAYVMLLMFIPTNIPRGLNEKNLITFFGPFIVGLSLLFIPSVRSYLYSGLGLSELGRSPLYILFTLVYGLGVPISVAAFFGGIHSLIYVNRGGLFLICYAVIPLALLLVISPFLNLHGYYLFFTMPAYLILAAFCASELLESASRRSKALAAVVIFIVFIGSLSQTYLYFMVENGGRPKWREALQSVKYRVDPDDTLVISIPRIAEYYLVGPSPGSSTREIPVMQLENVIKQLGVMENLWRGRKQDIWFVLDELSLSIWDPNRRFREWLYANCRLVEDFPVYARVADRTISIWHLEYKKTEPDANVRDEIFTF